MASAVLAGVVALVGVGPVSLDAHRAAKAPQLDSLALPSMARLTPAAAPAEASTPAVTAARATSSRRHESVISAAPARFEGAAPRAVPPPAALSNVSAQSARQNGTWAVIIGVNDYPGTSNDLESAVNDANDMVQALSGMGVAADHMVTLRDGQATDRTVLSAVDWLAAHAGTDAVAVFFYAGHVRKVQRGTEELVLSDGSSVTDATLARSLNKVVASRSWVGIAGCFGGGFTEVLKPGRVLTGAAPEDELAYENSAINRSYMVEYMIRQAMVLGRAPETVQTAFQYAVEHLREDHPGREPVEFDSSDGQLNLRPPGVATPSRSTAPEPAPEPAPSDEGGGGSQPPPEPPPNAKQPHCTQTGFVRYCQN